MKKKNNNDEPIDGIILIDKPPNITSHDAVIAARNILKTRKIGHTGTLDPFATGLLVLCVGRATRLAQFMTAEEKIYRGRITLGIETDSYDSDGTIIATAPTDSITRKGIRAAAAGLTGRIRQYPPPFSAKKIAGMRAYQLARKGKTPHLRPAEVNVDYFKVTSSAADHFDFETKVSAGTYIRSLAHDVGRALGCGAHLSMLERKQCGGYTLRKASKLPALSRLSYRALKKKVIPLEKILLPMPRIVIDPQGSSLFSHGNRVPCRHALELPATVGQGRVAVYSAEDRLLGIGILSKKPDTGDPEPVIQPSIVLS